ncbi:MAG: hypothetical protein II821_06245 [Treponema sp.]|nr:hypothetical protein [Treponema sp.]
MSKNTSKNQSTPKNKKIILSACVILALILVCAATALFMPSKKFTVGFYGIDDRQRQGITSVIDKILAEKQIPVTYTQYNSSKSLSSQLLLSKKTNLIITKSGFAVNEAVEKSSKKAFVPDNLTSGMTSSMRSAIIASKNNQSKAAAIPFLSSHFEADIETQDFRNSDVKQINTWSDVEKFLKEQKRKNNTPMVFAGGESDVFLDLIGAFAESVDGVSAYTDAVKILEEGEKSFNAAKIAVKLCDEPNSPLANSIKILKSWFAQGLIHNGTFSLKTGDVEAFASSKLSNVMFMNLETHRNFSQSAISRFTSIYFPSNRSANSRIFTGSIYYAVPMTKSKNADLLISALLETENQEALSRATGIAPVLAQCRTPDKQADDARYWIAATTAPLPGLSNEIFFTAEQKSQLSAEIAARIKN